MRLAGNVSIPFSQLTLQRQLQEQALHSQVYLLQMSMFLFFDAKSQ